MRSFAVLTAVVAFVAVAEDAATWTPPGPGERSAQAATTVCGTVYGVGVNGTGPSRVATLSLGGLTSTLQLTTLTGREAYQMTVTLRDGYPIPPEVEKEFFLKDVCVTGKVEMSSQSPRIVVREPGQIRLTGDSHKLEIPLAADAHWPWEGGVQRP